MFIVWGNRKLPKSYFIDIWSTLSSRGVWFTIHINNKSLNNTVILIECTSARLPTKSLKSSRQVCCLWINHAIFVPWWFCNFIKVTRWIASSETTEKTSNQEQLAVLFEQKYFINWYDTTKLSLTEVHFYCHVCVNLILKKLFINAVRMIITSVSNVCMA